MDLADFRASLSSDCPSAHLPRAMAALWWDAKGDWSRAHDLVATDETGRDAAWVHAYLHRKEGDASNARYWYGRAGRPVCHDDLDAEWDAIVATLLAGAQAG